MQKYKFVIVLFLSFISGCQFHHDNSTQGLPVTEQLRMDLENKQISKDEFYLYLTYCLFSREQLPTRYHGPLGHHDATPIIREIQRELPSLTPEYQNIIKTWIKPLPPKPKPKGEPQ